MAEVKDIRGRAGCQEATEENVNVKYFAALVCRSNRFYSCTLGRGFRSAQLLPRGLFASCCPVLSPHPPTVHRDRRRAMRLSATVTALWPSPCFLFLLDMSLNIYPNFFFLPPLHSGALVNMALWNATSSSAPPPSCPLTAGAETFLSSALFDDIFVSKTRPMMEAALWVCLSLHTNHREASEMIYLRWGTMGNMGSLKEYCSGQSP